MKIYESSLRFIRPSMYLQTFLEIEKKERNPKTRKDSTDRYHSVRYFSPPPTSDTHRSRTRSTLVFLNILKLSTPSKLSNLIFNSHIQSLHLEKPRVDRKQDDQQRAYMPFI